MLIYVRIFERFNVISTTLNFNKKEGALNQSFNCHSLFKMYFTNVLRKFAFKYNPTCNHISIPFGRYLAKTQSDSYHGNSSSTVVVSVI